VNWVITPPGPGSGGHTTLFRLVRHLVDAGHTCRIYVDDVYGSDAADHEPAVRHYLDGAPATVADVVAGMADADAVVATSWTTAYPAYNDPCAGKRFYLVQDFEPWFYAVSTTATLAENTYRMGFHGLTAGRWLAAKLTKDFAMAADGFDFGCDTARYHVLDDGLAHGTSRDGPTREGVPRDGIVFYARPDAPRRAFELGVLALECVARRRPDLAIHLYGDHIGALPFRFVDHGVLTPEALNAVYNRCRAGLSLSLTNVSLVPHEMLAAGCVPVVNDAHHNRVVLDNPHVCFAPASPHALAEAILEVVDDPAFAARSAAAAQSVKESPWSRAGEQVLAVLERELRS
jgi:glycosyltransferase involved in cell wall biosynthesis